MTVIGTKFDVRLQQKSTVVTVVQGRVAVGPPPLVQPALRALEISGVFATDDTEAFIAFLRSLDGVHVEVTATRIRVTQG